MKAWVAEKLICPECLATPAPLQLKIRNELRGDIIAGELSCPACNSRYPIEDGIAVVVPQKSRAAMQRNSGYNAPAMMSAYLWSHFGDLIGEAGATDAYQVWSKCLQTARGDALDIGCAVGRLSFELTRSHDRVIGVDTAAAFVAKAREIAQRKEIEFDLIVEGRLTVPRRLDLPPDWHPDRVDFIVADALALPFRPDEFATVTAINILEKVPDPLQHLAEINRVLRKFAAMFLFSDPFSWDETISSPELWLGGGDNGRFNARGIDTMRRIFAGEFGLFDPPLALADQGNVYWKIRKTENLWEHITSQFLAGRRE